MSIGPVEFLMISFPGSQFDGSIVPELERLIASDTVRIIDLVFVTKDEAGLTVAVEFDALDETAAAFASLDGDCGGLLNDEDIADAAEALEPGSSGVFIVWEDLWAAPLADAVHNAGGVILAGGRIPRDVMNEALDYVASAS